MTKVQNDLHFESSGRIAAIAGAIMAGWIIGLTLLGMLALTIVCLRTIW